MDFSISGQQTTRFAEFLSGKCESDLTAVSPAITRSRIRNILSKFNIASFDLLMKQLTCNETLVTRVLYDFSDTYRELFRDPVFLKQFRKKVSPMVKPLDRVKIWVPECGNGTEAFTLAITLIDTEAYNRVEILATDSNSLLLETAERGIYRADKIEKYIQNYEDSGGATDISEFIKVQEGLFSVRPEIRKQVTFKRYDVLTDKMNEQFHLIFCRNALIYYRREIQELILHEFYRSLHPRGILCVGEKENFRYFPVAKKFRDFAGKEKVFQKIG